MDAHATREVPPVPEPDGAAEPGGVPQEPVAGAVEVALAWLSANWGTIGFVVYALIMLVVFWGPVSAAARSAATLALPRPANSGDVLETDGPSEAELRRARLGAMARKEGVLRTESRAKADLAMSKKLAAREAEERREGTGRGKKVSSFAGVSMQEAALRSPADAARAAAEDAASVRREQDARYWANRARDERAASAAEAKEARRARRVEAARARAEGAGGAAGSAEGFELLVRMQGGTGGRLAMRARAETTLQDVMDWLELEAASRGGDTATAMQRVVIQRGLPSGMEGWRLCTFRPREELCSWRDFADGDDGAGGGGFPSRAARTLGEVGIATRATLVLEPDATA